MSFLFYVILDHFILEVKIIFVLYLGTFILMWEVCNISMYFYEDIK